ncbi:RidA family protein [Actinoplanes aureus]|uniref:RidA family protein n=1 Tax=Actinoplanes aureus TaxID=2792083 RepID=A0A931C042_9ACTN|nr:RidA family protein [Actinoplanes aureus]MBG0560810.1 RidA family protein [Actinoplanes aureus]
MGIWNNRLIELGITLPHVATPVGGYTPAIRSGMYVFTSGQLPFVGGTLPITGKVGDSVDVAQAADLARTAALNALAAVDALVGIDAVVRVVKVTGFVASLPSFTGQAQVLNGASTFLHDVFGSAGIHARSAVGLAVLPLDSPVEVELQVEITS